MLLSKATDYATKIVSWLGPYCERVIIAGSIRRRFANPSDIDLVIIPEVCPTIDLFGTVTKADNLLHSFLQTYCATGAAEWKSGRENPDGHNWILQLKKCQLDIFLATPETWGSILLCRTGPVRSNIALIERAKAMGMQWKTMSGLFRETGHLPCYTEEQLFEQFQLKYYPPELRDSDAYFAAISAHNFSTVGVPLITDH